jgi:ATP-dependent Zn protease
VKGIMTSVHGEARRILTEHREMLESVTRRLLDVEVMEGEELRRILGLPPAKHDRLENTPLPKIET